MIKVDALTALNSMINHGKTIRIKYNSDILHYETDMQNWEDKYKNNQREIPICVLLEGEWFILDEGDK